MVTPALGLTTMLRPREATRVSLAEALAGVLV
jgi:hypothetical protein